MFVTTHVLAGRIVGRLLPGRPIAALAVGALSHLAMDALPHWSAGTGPGSRQVFVRVARRDGLIGLAAIVPSIVSAPPGSRLSVLAGVTGAAAIDLDKPLMHFFGVNPFPKWFQWVHSVIQDESPRRLPLELAIAVVLALTMLAEDRFLRAGTAPDKRARRHIQPGGRFA